MEVETVIFWSSQDALTNSEDTQKLLGQLKKLRSYRIDTFRHLDFILSVETEKVLFPKVIEILNDCCSNG